MTPEALAALHARCFPARPWSATEFQDLMQARGMIWRVSPNQDGFVFAQTVPPEAEILTIAVAPEARRTGVARALMADLLAALPTAKVSNLFLEVADDNAAARALYHAIGFETAGRRRGYYPRVDAPAADALILRKALA
ncbi:MULTISPECIES: ribosomal protein S18-alanine N-acetyltransferase [unclassified Marinovum]